MSQLSCEWKPDQMSMRGIYRKLSKYASCATLSFLAHYDEFCPRTLKKKEKRKNSTPENQTGKGQFRDSETFGKKFETLGRQKNTQKTRLRDS